MSIKVDLAAAYREIHTYLLELVIVIEWVSVKVKKLSKYADEV